MKKKYSPELKRLIRKTITDNISLGGDSWKDYTDEELRALDLDYLIERRNKPN